MPATNVVTYLLTTVLAQQNSQQHHSYTSQYTLEVGRYIADIGTILTL